MNKIFTALLLLVLMTGSAWAKSEQLLKLTKQNVYTVLDDASDATPLYFDADEAKISCDVTCVSSQEVDTGTIIMINYDKNIDIVKDMTFLVQVTAKNQAEVVDNMMRCAHAVEVFAKTINSKIKDKEIKKLQQQIGIMSKGLIDGQKRESTYKNVTLSASFMQGVYVLIASPSAGK